MTRHRSHGFTLIEVLLSVAILAFVVAGISQVLIKQGQASSVQAGQRDLEESGRLALISVTGRPNHWSTNTGSRCPPRERISRAR